MKLFTYQDYLLYQQITLLKNITLQEETELYDYDYYKVNHPYDKIVRLVLENRKQVTTLINQVLSLDTPILEQELEKYNRSFINERFQNREADVIYKKKDQSIFFLIEHQTKIDYSMPQRILEYEIEIIKSALDQQKNIHKNSKLPAVIPIVIYTGKQKWNVKKYIGECQERLRRFNPVKLGQYYILDSNDYTQQELLTSPLFFLNVFAVEKAETEEMLVQNLSTLINSQKQGENKELLQKIIFYIFGRKLGQEQTKLMIQLFEKGGNDMVLEMIEREHQKLIRQGKEEGKLEGMEEGKLEEVQAITKEMLKNQIADEMILKITKITPKQLDKIKKCLEN